VVRNSTAFFSGAWHREASWKLLFRWKILLIMLPLNGI
jgi:hypothetical protein